jgi:4-amino-4-deoxy-L-arabinose transferase-like glycosyltransferase
VVLLLVTQWSLAVRSLLLENATVDEVVHLPAGVSYWEQGDYRLYPHNPPLIKLLTALPVLAAGAETDALYQAPSWGWADANKAAFAHGFMLLNAPRLMELTTLARLIIPTFAVLGGLVVFDWSRRLWGPWGGLLSLTLWAFCPNILAHSRLVTTDAAATAIGVAATYAFWHYLKRPTWRWVLVAGLMLGIAQLTKFSLLLLFGLWPLLWLIRELTEGGKDGRLRRIGRSLVQGVAMVTICVLIINIGYGFKGIGKPLGSFDFTCKTLTEDRNPPVPAYKEDRDFRSLNLKAGVLQFRVNRFRDTPLGVLPVPLPGPYVLGFDDQKLEAEGVPVRAMMLVDDPRGQGISRYEISGYPVYLDGALQNRSWWYYYIMTLVYKVPEGTWTLVLLSIVVLPAARRARSAPVDEAALWVVPAVVVLVMSFGTNIAIGLRYVLGIFPYLFIAAGRLAPWAIGLHPRGARALGIGVIAAALSGTVSASLLIHPHYLAYFNWASGGASRGSEHLIDSNLDWGQDLVGLKRWLDENAPGERAGIAYFGQINPETFNLESQASGGPRVLDWFLPPVRPGTLPERPAQASGPPKPGLYAVSASLMRGLPWRVYLPDRWAPLSAKTAEDVAGNQYGAFDYFAELEPIDQVGYSIFLYRVDAEDAKRLAPLWQEATVAP